MKQLILISSTSVPVFTTADFLLSLLLGLIVILVAFFIVQVCIPYFKTKNFEKKYVIPYEPSDDVVYEVCAYDRYPFEKGDLIVVKCSHKMHWRCWQENGYKCVEYGRHDRKGIQQFVFDKCHPFTPKNSPYCLKWAFSGAAGGFITAIAYLLIIKYFSLFNSLPALFGGALLGFVLTFIFAWINEFRQKTGMVFLAIMVRSVIGALAGFIAFWVGAIIFTLIENPNIIPFLGWIPWLLFGGSIALCLSIKTTIERQSALIGGLISGLVGFLALFADFIIPPAGIILSFIVCSAGVGVSVAVKHYYSRAQTYFLKFKHDKLEREIAIHSWLAYGNNQVTIGKSRNCVIQMNWDDSSEIHDTQAELYKDKTRKIVLKALESGMSFNGRDCRKYHWLKNGDKFKIGNTEFQYVER